MSLCYRSGMRPSLIVMPVLVCVPFGLAIRATTNRVTPEEQAAGLRVRMQIREAADESRAIAIRAEAIASLHQIYGAKPAQLGELFEGLALGMPRSAVDETRLLAYRYEPMTIAAVSEYDVVARIEISPHGDDDLCHELHVQLAAAWGKPLHDHWLDPATHQRASRGEHPCVTFAKYTPLAEWIGDHKPEWLALVGTSVAKLRQQELVDQADQFDDDSLVWVRPGLEGSDDPLRFTARVARGTIVGVSVDVRADDDTVTAVFDRLEHALGKAEEVDGVSTFPGAPVVRFQRLDREHAEIRIGKPEAPESDL